MGIYTVEVRKNNDGSLIGYYKFSEWGRVQAFCDKVKSQGCYVTISW